MTIDTYEELIEVVDMFDPDAAQYLRTDARKLSHFDAYESLSICFSWRDAPQGYDYWCNLNIKVREFERTGNPIVKRSKVPKELFEF